MKQLLVLSGKGGTGKTTLVSSFIELGGFKAFADCDVDAPNLQLISGQSGILPEKAHYLGMDKVSIDSSLCIECGLCQDNCRFNSIEQTEDGKYRVNHYSCEGCGVCKEFCPADAISWEKNVAGETQVYHGESFLSTAKLKMGEGNSGLLVNQVKENLKKIDEPYAIVDGSPGIGCPVISSLSGVHMVILVTEPSLSGISDLERIVETAQGFKINPFVVINKYDINMDKTETIEQWCNEKGLTILGKIPFEKSCNHLLNQKSSLVEGKTDAAMEIRSIHRKAMKILKDIK